MKEHFKVSIAMTTYNGERYIEQQLYSILKQTREPDEVVIFDDRSNDKTADIISEFIKKNGLNNWIVKINEENIGFISNFYKAIEKTSGDIVFLCDQDDVWHTDKVEKILLYFIENEDIKILNTGFRKIDQKGEILPTKLKFNRSNNNLIKQRIGKDRLKKFGLDYIIWKNISPGCTAAFSKDCKDFFIKNHTNLCPHDWELNLFGAVLGGLYFYDEPLIDYRIHSGNTTGLADINIKERLRISVKDPRIESAESEFHRACAYVDSVWYGSLDEKQKKILIRYRFLTGKRNKALSEKRLLSWFGLLWYLTDYLRLRGLQGVFNDFLYVTKEKI
jgi:glycosyltransferase involved in cell wall biosynthesis